MQFQKTSAWKKLFTFKAPLLRANHFFLINHIHKLFWHFNLNEHQRKKFVLIIIQLSEVDIQPSFELFELSIHISRLFIHVTNFKITITISNLKWKCCIYYLKSWHFLNNRVSYILEERSSTVCAYSPHNLGMRNWNQEVWSGVSYYTTFHKT